MANEVDRYPDRAKSQSSQSTLPTKKLSTGVEVVDWEKAKAQGLASTAPAKTTETRVSLNTGQKTNKTKVSNDSTYTPKEQTQSQTETKAQAPQSTLPTKKLSTGVEVVDWEKAKEQGLASTSPAKTTETLSEKAGFQSSKSFGNIPQPSAKSALQMQALKPTMEPVSAKSEYASPYLARDKIALIEADIKAKNQNPELLISERTRLSQELVNKFYKESPIYSQEMQGTKYQTGVELVPSIKLNTGINVPYINRRVFVSEPEKKYIEYVKKIDAISAVLKPKQDIKKDIELPFTQEQLQGGFVAGSGTESSQYLRSQAQKKEERAREISPKIPRATSILGAPISRIFGEKIPAFETLSVLGQKEAIEETLIKRGDFNTTLNDLDINIKTKDVVVAEKSEDTLKDIKKKAITSIVQGGVEDILALGATALVGAAAVKVAGSSPAAFKAVKIIDKLDDISDVIEVSQGVFNLATGNPSGSAQNIGNIVSGNIVAGKVSSKVASGIDFSGVAPAPKAPLFDKKLNFEFKEQAFTKSYAGQKIVSTPEGTIFSPDVKINADAVKISDADYVLAQSVKRQVKPEGLFELSKTTTETEIFSAPEFKKLVSKRSFTPEAKQTTEFYSSTNIKPIGIIKGETILDLDTGTFSRRPEGVKDIIRAGPLGVSKSLDIRQTLSQEIGITERTLPITNLKSQYKASDRAARINPFITKRSTVLIEGRLSRGLRSVSSRIKSILPSFKSRAPAVKPDVTVESSRPPTPSTVKPQATPSPKESSLILATKEKPLSIVFESDIKATPSPTQTITPTLKTSMTYSLKSKTTPKYQSKTYSLPTLTTPSPVLELEKELKLSPSPTLRLDTALLPELDLKLDTQTITQTINENPLFETALDLTPDFTGKTPSLTPDSKLTKTKYPKNYRALVPRGRSAREFTVTNRILDLAGYYRKAQAPRGQPMRVTKRYQPRAFMMPNGLAPQRQVQAQLNRLFGKSKKKGGIKSKWL